MQNIADITANIDWVRGTILGGDNSDGRKKAGMVRPIQDREPELKEALIMLVDDEPINIEVVQTYLEDFGYRHFIGVDDSTQAFPLAVRRNPDVILLDLMMPQVSGFDILAMLQRDPRLNHTPVVVLTSNTDSATKLRALELGATDFLNKPVDPSELALRLQNILSAKAFQDRLASYSATLERQVRIRTEQLESAHRQIICCLARAAEFRDNDTGKHVIRVGRYAGVVARQMGFDHKFVEEIQIAAQLHDVGKIGVPDSILLNPRRLDPEEYLLMKGHCDIESMLVNGEFPDCEAWKAMIRHTEIGATIMGIPDTSIMRMAAVIADSHHERCDGCGYPKGLRGEQIPIEGRITAVADVFDGLTSKRSYKPAFDPQTSLLIVKGERGKHFDPDVIDAFVGAVEEILNIQSEMADEN